jgi:hypothetical protein
LEVAKVPDSIEENAEEALAATANQPVEVKAAAVGAAIAAISSPPPPVVAFIWKMLVGGLILALLAALAGIIFVVVDGSESTSPDVIVTVFTSVLTGLIGLFVRSPSQSGGG